MTPIPSTFYTYVAHQKDTCKPGIVNDDKKSYTKHVKHKLTKGCHTRKQLFDVIKQKSEEQYSLQQLQHVRLLPKYSKPL